MVTEPTCEKLVVQVAVAFCRAMAPQDAITADPLLKETVPPAPAGLTVAVMVTVCHTVTDDGAVERVTVDDGLVITNCAVPVVAALFESPP